MTITFRARYDGRALVPEEPIDLPVDQELIVRAESAESSADAPAPVKTTGREMIQLARRLNFSSEDLAEMQRAIEAGCERIDPDGW
jgi:hypothetical protein